jgi:hypothetical protein
MKEKEGGCELGKRCVYVFKTPEQNQFLIPIFFSDSFCLLVNNNKLFQSKMKSHMDYSNYPRTHPLFDNSRANELNFFKNELKGVSKCVEFVGLRSKCYAMKLRQENGNFIEKKVCKGIGKVAIKNRLKFAEYKKCLFEGDEIRHNFTSILSQKQKLFTVIRNKKALSRFDSKRWLFQCGIHSVPFNSILIKKYGNKCFKCKN